MIDDLFGDPPLVPGLEYRHEALSPEEEAALLANIRALPFAPFDFHGFKGNRRVVSFGWKYDFSSEALRQTEAIPDFLLPVREHSARGIDRQPERFEQVLVTEYAPGAGIGWHKDKAVFDEVMGVSLAAACTLRLRRKEGSGWGRRKLELEPRSVYLFSGEVRSHWEHSIPPVSETRYSLTFRTLRR
ncbi:MAG TPA: alpha-ketoglutarate-dependent dioxygenase AlkB [Devosia sp.]